MANMHRRCSLSSQAAPLPARCVPKRGAPVAAASICVSSAALGLSYFGQSGSDGTFILSDVYPGTYDVAVGQTSSVEFNCTVTVALGGAAVVNATLVPGAVVAGRVIDVDSTNPVPEAQIQATSQESGQVVFATTDADGDYALPALPTGQWEITVSCAGYVTSAAQVLAVTDASPVALDIALATGASVSGIVTGPTGTPLADALISITGIGVGATTVTAADGTYSLAGLLGGDLQLSIRADGYAAMVSSIAGLGPHEQRAGVNFVMSVGYAVTGIVTDSSGTPLSGATVTLSPNSGGAPTVFATADDGRIEVEHLPGEIYLCTVQIDGYVACQPHARPPHSGRS